MRRTSGICSENTRWGPWRTGNVYMTRRALEAAAYFRKHGDYQYHSFAEVDRALYADEESMTLYMLGLSLGEYLWENLLRIHRSFEENIREASGERYLEIGPGHGKYFLEAYRLGRFQRYTAVDVSPTAIQMTREYLQYNGMKNEPGGGSYQLIVQDATTLGTTEKYDHIVAQEVLEHLEDPLQMLRTIRELLTEEGRAYLLMPIMAPSPAHIYLFRSREHVRSILSEAGMEILSEEFITANGISAETAEVRKLPINACMIVKRGGI